MGRRRSGAAELLAAETDVHRLGRVLALGQVERSRRRVRGPGVGRQRAPVAPADGPGLPRRGGSQTR